VTQRCPAINLGADACRRAATEKLEHEYTLTSFSLVVRAQLVHRGVLIRRRTWRQDDEVVLGHPVFVNTSSDTMRPQASLPAQPDVQGTACGARRRGCQCRHTGHRPARRDGALTRDAEDAHSRIHTPCPRFREGTLRRAREHALRKRRDARSVEPASAASQSGEAGRPCSSRETRHETLARALGLNPACDARRGRNSFSRTPPHPATSEAR
jgi:hypothetical protein